MTTRKKLPKGWRQGELRKYVQVRSGTVNPMRFPDEVFELHSIPAFDNDKQPEFLLGRNIRSSKVMIQPGDCLFSKLNPRICRVWLVRDRDGKRQVATTEFWPLYSRTDKDDEPYILGEFLEFYLAWPKFRETFTGQVEASTKSRQRLKPDQLLEQQILLPPLAEQERIVEVLRQADAIRRKRAEARRLADQILPALFLDMFGDPITNPKNWPVTPFEQVLKDQTRKAGKLPIAEYQAQGEYPIIDQGEKFISGYTNRADCVFNGTLPVVLFGDHTRRLKYVDFPFVLGADGVKILRPIKGVPAFIYQQLRAAPIPSRGYERHFKYLKELSFVLPPKHLQEWLAGCFTQYYESEKHTTEALLDAERLFSVLLSRAFTGELTAQGMDAIRGSVD